MRLAHVCILLGVCVSVTVCSTIRNTPDTTSNELEDDTTRVTVTEPMLEQTTELKRDDVTLRPRDVTVLPKDDVTVRLRDVTLLPKDVTVRLRDVTLLPKDATGRPRDVTVRPKDVTVLPKDVTVLPRDDVTVTPRDVTVSTKEEVTELPDEVSTLSKRDEMTTVSKRDDTTEQSEGDQATTSRVDLPVLLGRSLEIETNELDHNAVDNNGAVLICPDPELIGKDHPDAKDLGADLDLGADAAPTVAHRPCRRDRDCQSVGEQCCPDRRGYHRCTLGVPPPQPEAPRSAFLGLLSRECPSSASSLIEPWPVINCTRDEECWPRLCCRDAPGAPAFCRSPRPLWERMATPGLRSMLAYLQCTPPPPPVFDLFPKPCRSTFDCFPNLCCQERGRKVCRPPKRSLLALIASVGQSVGSRFPILRIR